MRPAKIQLKSLGQLALLTLAIVSLSIVAIAAQRPGAPKNVRIKGSTGVGASKAAATKTPTKDGTKAPTKAAAPTKASAGSGSADQSVHLHVAHTLAPESKATAKAVKSGSWSDPGTWSGKVPGEWERVLIPKGLTVTLDGEFGPYHWIRADGKLRTDPTRDTTLRVDSLFVNMEGGSLEIPCTPPDKSATIVFHAYQNAPIDKTWDFTENSRGLIAEGPVTICGAQKTAFVAVSKLPVKGATSISIDGTVQGWKPGDRVVLTSGKYGEDEEREIAGASGNVITLKTPLTNDHSQNVPKGEVLHLANLSRNVRITSAAPGNLKLRGHVMLMDVGHSVKYAEFADVGRTGMSVPTDPIVVDGKNDPQLFPLCGGEKENVRGRYPLHFHRAAPDTTASIVDGVVVRAVRNSGVRWGLVNHSSNVEVRNTVVYQIDGSQFVTEEGDEVGVFENSIAIYSRGFDTPLPGQPGDPLCMRRNYQELWARRRSSVGHRGIGFWLQGGGVVVRGTVASGHSEAYAIDSALLSKRHPDTYTVKFSRTLLRGDKSWATKALMDTSDVPALVESNVAYASARTQHSNDAALTFLSHGSKTLTRYPNAPKTLIKDFRAWNVRRGILGQYSGNVRFENVSVNAGTFGTGGGTIGVQIGAQGGHAFQLANVSISGFVRQMRTLGPGSTCQNVTVDGQPLDCTPYIKVQ
jgi:hypothetical protein